ncbi:MAG TPA: ATP synthase F0 subunit C [Gemmataceae bacterium]|jgi:F-type H+-transporting ATPase subunit c|nr:ATP synthase F0 subunit C [Gemmataceae bacterium]
MKVRKYAYLALAVLFVGASPALAQGPSTSVLSGAAIAAGLGMGLTIIGAGIGLGRIGSAAMEGMARQPEVAARIQTAMLIIAAMLEGATLASVVLCYLVSNIATW